MKRRLQIFTSASVVSLLAFSFSGLADETVPTYQRMSQSRSEQLNGAARATDIIGMTVHYRQNENLGQVEDLVVDVESGRVVRVILSTGGFFGRTNALIALPPGALRYDDVAKDLQLDAGKWKIAKAPVFDASRWDADTQFNRETEVPGRYAEQPYFVADCDGYRNASLNGTVASTRPHRLDGSINTDSGRTLDRAGNVETARNLEATNNWISTLNPDGAWTREYYSNERRANNAWVRLGYVQRAGKLLGTPVKNLQGQEIGKVENFMVDVSAGRIVAVIISTGGFLELGDELSPVPPAALRFNAEHDALRLDTSREMLAGSLHFKAGQWPDFSQPGYAGGVYHAYAVEPYFSPAATTDADNTRLGIRDPDGSTLTTLDQGNHQTDVETEAQIRREIVADRGMSANAKNVKITAIDGRVILCGPVNSETEKHLIGEIANRIVHTGNVDNQLEVQFALTSSN